MAQIVCRFLLPPLLLAFALSAVAQSYSTGSGFFVTTDGYFVTNHHVINSAKKIVIRTTDGRRHPASLIRVDADNDIAILKAEGKFSALPVESSQNVRRGHRVFTLGFPNVGVQGVEVKYTEGVISSLTGLSDAPTNFQITVPLQPGNSGGPLISGQGNVIGLVTSKLSAAAMVKRGSSLPENVNCAVKSNYLLELLSTLSVVKGGMLAVHSEKNKRTMSELAAQAEPAIGLVIATNETEEQQATPTNPPAPQPAPQPPPVPQLSAADMYARGQQALRSGRDTDAVEWFRKAAIQGDAQAQTSLGTMYALGKGGLPQDDAQVVEWYRKAAVQGNALAQGKLGAMYYLGRGGLPKDDVQAVAWYRKAAGQGNAQSQDILGSMYEKGEGGLQKDDAQAVEWYGKAAVQGEPRAQTNLGNMYANGKGGLPKDDVQAAEWYRKAVVQGYAQAQTSLGNMYANGRGGLSKDDVQAVELYRKAAAQDEPSAQNNLGLMYLNGRGGLAKDDVQAVAWFRKAAAQDFAYGQSNLGFMYESGRGGLIKDRDEAINWFRKAAAQGDETAKSNLQRLGVN